MQSKKFFRAKPQRRKEVQTDLNLYHTEALSHEDIINSYLVLFVCFVASCEN